MDPRANGVVGNGERAPGAVGAVRARLVAAAGLDPGHRAAGDPAYRLPEGMVAGIRTTSRPPGRAHRRAERRRPPTVERKASRYGLPPGFHARIAGAFPAAGPAAGRLGAAEAGGLRRLAHPVP